MPSKQKAPKANGDSRTDESQAERKTNIRVSTPAVKRMRGEKEPQGPTTGDAQEQPAVESTSATPEDAEKLVVFAFRLTRAERDLIHAAAGSAKASRFVRKLAVAAASNDDATVKTIMCAAHATE